MSKVIWGLGLFIMVSILIVGTLVDIEAKTKVYGGFENVEYVRNYDGDTITFNIPDVHPLIGKAINIRVLGIDTPEIRGKCFQEKGMAYDGRYLIEGLLRNAKVITLKNMQRGKYFRIVAEVYVDGVSVAQTLIDANLAVPYDGGTKTKDWCIPHVIEK